MNRLVLLFFVFIQLSGSILGQVLPNSEGLYNTPKTVEMLVYSHEKEEIWSLKTRTVYTYDTINRIIQLDRYIDSSIIQSEEWEYNKLGFTYKVSSPNLNFYEIREFQVDYSSDHSVRSIYEQSFGSSFLIERTYLQNRKRINSIFDYDGNLFSTTSVFDSLDRIITMMDSTVGGVSKYVYEYSDTTDILVRKYYNDSLVVGYSLGSYVFDEQGNWIERVAVLKEENSSIKEVRRISYWE